MYILGHYSLQQSVELREMVLAKIKVKEHFTEAWGDAVISQSSEKILDPALSKRSNGVLLLGKSKTTGGCWSALYFFCSGVEKWLCQRKTVPSGVAH